MHGMVKYPSFLGNRRSWKHTRSRGKAMTDNKAQNRVVNLRRQSRYLPSSPQDPLLPAGLPICLTSLLLRLRFGFADHCARL